VLRTIGTRVRELVRDADVCCRIGGEEFALLMPGMGGQDAEVAFQRLSAAIRAPIAIEGHYEVVTISGGIAVLDREGGSPDELMRDADRALYAAKGAGRDRVVVAPAAGPARGAA